MCKEKERLTKSMGEMTPATLMHEAFRLQNFHEIITQLAIDGLNTFTLRSWNNFALYLIDNAHKKCNKGNVFICIGEMLNEWHVDNCIVLTLKREDKNDVYFYCVPKIESIINAPFLPDQDIIDKTFKKGKSKDEEISVGNFINKTNAEWDDLLKLYKNLTEIMSAKNINFFITNLLDNAVTSFIRKPE